MKRPRASRAVVIVVAIVATFLVQPAAQSASRPDLVVASVSRTPSFRSPGTQFTLTDKVKNKGSKLAGKSVTRFYLSHDRKRGNDIALAGRRKVSSLKPGLTSKGSTQLTVPATTPTFVYYLLACADATKNVKESKEGNNCKVAAGRILVDAPPASANPLTVEVTLGAGEVTESIASDSGGTLSTVTTDGTAYELDIPPGALLEDTDITMTPLSSVEGSSSSFSFAGGLAGGVDLKPDGLHLYEPARLTITPADGAPDGTTPLGFAFDGAGEQMHLHPWKTGPSSIIVELTHFSGFGAGNGDAADLGTLSSSIPLQSHVEFRTEHTLGELIAQLQAEEITQEEFWDAASTAAIKDFMRDIVPLGQQALKDDADEHEAWAAVEACFSWGRQMELLGLMDHGSPQLGLMPRTLWDECLKQIALIAKKRFDLADERCKTDASQIGRMQVWARLAELQLDGAESVLGSDYAQRIRDCIGPGEGFSGTVLARQIYSSEINDFEFTWQASATFGQGSPLNETTIRYPLDSGALTVTVEDAPGKEDPCEIVDGTESFQLHPERNSRIEITGSRYGGFIHENDGALGLTVTITIDCPSSGVRERKVRVPDPNLLVFWWDTHTFGRLLPPVVEPDGSLVGTHTFTTSNGTTEWSWHMTPVS